ncbi:hypothetical protein N8Z64_08015 [Pseudomonadales bacterium]|jgi:hypothetical protein|nr:hypothetical protein [Pseudomonadales bacterium]
MNNNASYWGSPESTTARQQLREIAFDVASQLGRDGYEVLEQLQRAQKPPVSPAEIEFEMGLHKAEHLRETVEQAMDILTDLDDSPHPQSGRMRYVTSRG